MLVVGELVDGRILVSLPRHALRRAEGFILVLTLADCCAACWRWSVGEYKIDVNIQVWRVRSSNCGLIQQCAERLSFQVDWKCKYIVVQSYVGAAGSGD